MVRLVLVGIVFTFVGASITLDVSSLMGNPLSGEVRGLGIGLVLLGIGFIALSSYRRSPNAFSVIAIGTAGIGTCIILLSLFMILHR